MGKLTISMAMFNSYVKLPEGKRWILLTDLIEFSQLNISNWWLTYPPEKYESQIGSSSQRLGKIKAMFQTTNQI